MSRIQYFELDEFHIWVSHGTGRTWLWNPCLQFRLEGLGFGRMSGVHYFEPDEFHIVTCGAFIDFAFIICFTTTGSVPKNTTQLRKAPLNKSTTQWMKANVIKAPRWSKFIKAPSRQAEYQKQIIGKTTRARWYVAWCIWYRVAKTHRMP